MPCRDVVALFILNCLFFKSHVHSSLAQKNCSCLKGWQRKTSKIPSPALWRKICIFMMVNEEGEARRSHLVDASHSSHGNQKMQSSRHSTARPRPTNPRLYEAQPPTHQPTLPLHFKHLLPLPPKPIPPLPPAPYPAHSSAPISPRG